MSNLATIIGYIAGFLTTAAYLPQVLRIIKTRQTRDLSLTAYVMLNVGMGFWVTYGVILGSWPLIIPNVTVLLFTLPILVMKIKNG